MEAASAGAAFVKNVSSGTAAGAMAANAPIVNLVTINYLVLSVIIIYLY